MWSNAAPAASTLTMSAPLSALLTATTGSLRVCTASTAPVARPASSELPCGCGVSALPRARLVVAETCKRAHGRTCAHQVALAVAQMLQLTHGAGVHRHEHAWHEHTPATARPREELQRGRSLLPRLQLQHAKRTEACCAQHAAFGLQRARAAARGGARQRRAWRAKGRACCSALVDCCRATRSRTAARSSCCPARPARRRDEAQVRAARVSSRAAARAAACCSRSAPAALPCCAPAYAPHALPACGARRERVNAAARSAAGAAAGTGTCCVRAGQLQSAHHGAMLGAAQRALLPRFGALGAQRGRHCVRRRRAARCAAGSGAAVWARPRPARPSACWRGVKRCVC
jgi:hypothetical protein